MRQSVFTTFLLAISLSGLNAEITFEASGSIFEPGNPLTIARGTDVVVEIQCNSSSSMDLTWAYSNMTDVPSPLTAFGVSQYSGLLRIYPSTLLDDSDLKFICNGIDLTLELADDLFFIDPLPPVLYSNNLTCKVPDIPDAMVVTDTTTISDTVFNVSYCNVSSDRGSFSSGPIAIVPPVFVIQPLTTSTTADGEAAFSCAVASASDSLILDGITWMTFNTPVMGSDGVTIIANESTSILYLNGTLIDGTSYYCVASFNNGAVTINSNTAILQIVSNDIDPFVLRPPTSLTVVEGSNAVLPCIGENGVMWTNSGMEVLPDSEFFLKLMPASAGNYTCTEADGMMATVELIVIVPIRFSSVLPNETIVGVGDSMMLVCDITGSPMPDIVWLVNNTEISTGSTLLLPNIQPNDTGIYQCTATSATFPYSTITSHTYLLVQFIEEAIAEPAVQLVDPLMPENITLTCTVRSHPLVQITWRNGSMMLEGRQVPVGFRGPSVSELTIDTTDLVGTTNFICEAELNGTVVMDTAVVNAFSPVTLLEEPNSTEPVLVGATVTFQCRTSSLPLASITWFTGGNDVELSNTMNNITITMVTVDDLEVSSELNVTVDEDSDFADYFCFGNNGLQNATSRNATLVRGVPANASLSPSDTVLKLANTPRTITCTAIGVPVPSIQWSVDGNVVSSSNDMYALSVLSYDGGSAMQSITLSTNANNTDVVCTATNVFNVDIATVVVIIAAPPLTPIITQVVPQAREAMVSWSEPFSHFSITKYIITLMNVTGGDTAMFTSPNTSFTITSDLSPFRNFTVIVVANSPAGMSNGDMERFETLQAAPEGTPTDLASESVALGTISLTWMLPPSYLRNGIITSYTITYFTDAVTNSTISTQPYAILTGLSDGTRYTIIVNASTIAGTGPGIIITQSTITAPPDVVDEQPSMPPDLSVSTTTIPMTIPEFEDTEQIWIIVVKLNSSLIEQVMDTNPGTLYPTNDSFVFGSDEEIPAGRPYVAAEISVASPLVTFPYNFIIGDDDMTESINDYPGYSNPALETGTAYTAFIRVFPPAAEEGVVSKRQVNNARQYTVFTSTDFLPPVSTQNIVSSAGLSAGAIVGIVIAILLAILIVVVIVGVVVLYIRPRIQYIPPPSRKGSMRLTESEKVTVVQNVHHNAHLGSLGSLVPPDEREPILISYFASYVKRLHANTDHLFSEEYEVLSIKAPSLAHQASLLPYNIEKNRYGNINSCDDTRVILKPIEGMLGSDYINANYIDGYDKPNQYIACQGPLAETTQDFWRMVWEQQVCCIVMLTNCVEKGRQKCHQYWPQNGSVSLGDMSITVIDQQILAYYTIRTFRLMVGAANREVKQFHFTAWPDFGVPDHPNPILAFIRRVDQFKRPTEGPDVIHCSAGVGRTGTYITIQAMMKMVENEGKIDVFNFVLRMRHQRNFMVQTEAQYMFIHDALVELLRIGHTELTVQNISKELKALTTYENDEETMCPLEKEFEKLQALDVADHRQFISASLAVNQPKNRYPDIMPYEQYRVRLLMLPGVNGSDYINASYVDGYLRCNQFIMTQGPLQSTVNDFWRMIWECRVSAIVMLCKLEENEKETSACYWPSDKLTQYGDLFVETTNETNVGFYTIRDFSMTHTKQNNEIRQVKHFHYTDWSEETCPSSAPIIDMIGLVQKAHHLLGGGPVVVHDSSSIGRSGTFCVLNIVLERLKVEGMIDMFFTVHSLRRKHPGIVANYQQYLFCYKTIVDYLDSFDKYANFVD